MKQPFACPVHRPVVEDGGYSHVGLEGCIEVYCGMCRGIDVHHVEIEFSGGICIGVEYFVRGGIVDGYVEVCIVGYEAGEVEC